MSTTSWGGVASWYGDLLGEDGTFQKDVILPNVLRLLGSLEGQRVLDVGCGPGFFVEAFSRAGAREVVGVDVGAEMIALAEERTRKLAGVSLHKASADALGDIADGSFTMATCVLALQNMGNVPAVIREVLRALAAGGTFHLVLNHPAFRVPKASGWGWDEKAKVQFRRVDAYMGEQKIKIQMHPGQDASVSTVSYHHPISFFIKVLVRNGFVVTGMEEWVSNKVSDSGPRAEAENVSRKEIPMFLYLQARKV